MPLFWNSKLSLPSATRESNVEMNRDSAAVSGSLVTTSDTEWVILVQFSVLLAPVDEGHSFMIPVEIKGNILESWSLLVLSRQKKAAVKFGNN